jgi:hypothetical protein
MHPILEVDSPLGGRVPQRADEQMRDASGAESTMSGS